jgi:subfamily B ATP-binding cassette protein MsbA
MHAKQMTVFFQRIWSLARPYKTRLFLGLICGILFALANSAMLVVIKMVGDLVLNGSIDEAFVQKLNKVPAVVRPLADYLVQRLPELRSPTSKLGLTLVILAIPVIMATRALFGYLNVYLMSWAAQRAVADLRTRLFNHLQNLPLSFFSQARTGDLIARVTNDTLVLYSIMGNSLASMVKDPVTLLCVLGVMLSQPDLRKLTLISLLILPACLIPINIYNRKVRKSARVMQGTNADLTTLMHESFTGNRIIKAYNLEDKVLDEFRGTTKKYISHLMRVVRASELPSQLTEFLGGLGITLVLLYIVFQPGQSHVSAGDFSAFALSMVFMYQPIKSLTRLNNQLHQAEAASHRVFELLQTVNTVTDPPVPVPLKAANAEIHFENIDFDYGDKPTLRGINLTVKAGQLVALVGSSGAGKTTLTNLLLRFYDPKSGAVRIGSTDIRQVAIKDLRRQIALVAQETILFNDTIRSNISLGRPGATDAEIEAAAKHAYAHDFILQQPHGYETVVGEKGAALSGGQRQRLTLARAILRDAPILVLDEAMSALDSESERVVQAALDKLMHGRTTICIAHRLSTIQNADLIVVLDQGRIVETGTHAQLLEARGTYFKLYDLQFKGGVT